MTSHDSILNASNHVFNKHFVFIDREITAMRVWEIDDVKITGYLSQGRDECLGGICDWEIPLPEFRSEEGSYK
jgi:hypothetical protein